MTDLLRGAIGGREREMRLNLAHRWAPRIDITQVCLTVVMLTTPSIAAAAIAVGGGYEYYCTNPEITRTASVVVATGVGTGSASLTGLRYEDNLIGNGYGAIAGVAVPCASRVVARAWGTRYVGDGAFEAWRIKSGLQFALPARTNLGLYYAHYGNNARVQSDGGIAEFAVTVAPSWVVRANASDVSVAGGEGSSQATLGAVWTALRYLELAADAGLARNGSAATAPFVSRKSVLPLLGGPSDSSANEPITAHSMMPAYQVGVRLLFP